jgi:hypothetical protein
MATITIKSPFTIEVKGECWFDCEPTDSRGAITATESGIDTFEYKVDGKTKTLPTTGSASSAHATASADLDDISDITQDDPPPNPFTLEFNTGTATRIPSTGSPYRVDVTDVDADLEVTGAASAETLDAGGTVIFHGGGTGYPTRKR